MEMGWFSMIQAHQSSLARSVSLQNSNAFDQNPRPADSFKK